VEGGGSSGPRFMTSSAAPRFDRGSVLPRFSGGTEVALFLTGGMEVDLFLAGGMEVALFLAGPSPDPRFDGHCMVARFTKLGRAPIRGSKIWRFAGGTETDRFLTGWSPDPRFAGGTATDLLVGSARCQWTSSLSIGELIPWTVEPLLSPVGCPGAPGAAAGGDRPSRFTAGGDRPSRFTAGGAIISRFTTGRAMTCRLERFWRGLLAPNRIREKTENRAEKYMASIA
jgi:hypothetical protein